jgi:hypothetical protein
LVLFDVFSVMPAIQLDNETTVKTNKINNERYNGVLPAKLESGKTPAAHMVPENPFSFGLAPLQLSGPF